MHTMTGTLLLCTCLLCITFVTSQGSYIFSIDIFDIGITLLTKISGGVTLYPLENI